MQEALAIVLHHAPAAERASSGSRSKSDSSNSSSSRRKALGAKLKRTPAFHLGSLDGPRDSAAVLDSVSAQRRAAKVGMLSRHAPLWTHRRRVRHGGRSRSKDAMVVQILRISSEA